MGGEGGIDTDAQQLDELLSGQGGRERRGLQGCVRL